jgi:hypothetical protein
MEKRKRNAELLNELGLSNTTPEAPKVPTEPTVAATPIEVCTTTTAEATTAVLCLPA